MSVEVEFHEGQWVRASVPSLPDRFGEFRGVSNRGLFKIQPWSRSLGRLAHSVLYFHPDFVSAAESPLERLDRIARNST